MNFVYLSPHFPPNFIDFVRALRERDVTVLGLGDQPWDQLSGEVQAHLNDYRQVDLHDYEQVLRACGGFIERHGRIDRLDSHAEYWLETEARLRSDFNVPGLRAEFLSQFKSKWQMKQRYVRAGVPVARGRLAPSPEEAREFAREVGFPLVAKPDVGVGAAATYRINDESELEHFFAQPPSVPYLFEEYIQGSLISFDGLVDRQGEPLFLASHVFGRGIMETVNEADHLAYYSERAISPELLELGRRTIAAFELKERFFHFEFFRGPRGITALEVNLRPPGGLTANMLCWANDADIFAEWASLIAHGQGFGKFERPHHVYYVSRKDHKSYLHSHDEVLARIQPYLVHHQAIEPVFRGAIGDYAYVLRHAELAPLHEAAAFIQALRP